MSWQPPSPPKSAGLLGWVAPRVPGWKVLAAATPAAAPPPASRRPSKAQAALTFTQDIATLLARPEPVDPHPTLLPVAPGTLDRKGWMLMLGPTIDKLTFHGVNGAKEVFEAASILPNHLWQIDDRYNEIFLLYPYSSESGAKEFYLHAVGPIREGMLQVAAAPGRRQLCPRPSMMGLGPIL